MPPSRRSLKKSLRTALDPDWRWYLRRALWRARQAGHVPAFFAGGKVTEPVFIIGAPRSGTTLLYLTLRTSSRLAHWWPSEAHEVWEADYHPALREWESNVLTAADVKPREATRIKRSFVLVAGTRKRLLEKSPRNSLRVPFVDALFPDARYVLVQRDGRENVNSLINAWRSPRYRTYRLPESHAIPGVDPEWWKFVLYPGWREDMAGPLEVVCARQWTASMRFAREGLRQIGAERQMTVAYEDLVRDPGTVVGKVLNFLELPYEPVVRARAEAVSSTPVNFITPPERGKWRRENPAEIEAVSALLTPMMRELGYD